jgi:ketopantoate reductase
MSVDKSQHDLGGKMKTLIVGSGVIYGWALSQAGEDVTHLVRPGRKDRFQG